LNRQFDQKLPEMNDFMGTKSSGADFSVSLLTAEAKYKDIEAFFYSSNDYLIRVK